MTEFQQKIDAALLNGEEWVETSPKIITYFNRKGLGPHAKYFVYKNIKICEFGQSEAIQAHLNRQMGNLIYGDGEAKSIGTTDSGPPRA